MSNDWRSESVTQKIRDILDEREKKGVEHYGTTLNTFNGRDALKDELEEFVDAFQYRVQAALEFRELKSKVESLRNDKARLVNCLKLAHQFVLYSSVDGASECALKTDALLRSLGF